MILNRGDRVLVRDRDVIGILCREPEERAHIVNSDGLIWWVYSVADSSVLNVGIVGVFADRMLDLQCKVDNGGVGLITIVRLLTKTVLNGSCLLMSPV